ncbi:MAG: ATP-binding protein [Thermoguttaceae bacterium]|jgi:signal transduction histidine kinase|nr:ATP-binding protein [Thermoguttaceae bacterium]
MSYQSIKRVLGESSLERKCLFLFGVALLVLISASFWWYGARTEEVVFQQNRVRGRLLVDQIMYIEHWEKLETDERFLPLVQDLAGNLRKQEYKSRFIRPYYTDRDQQPKTPLEERLLERFTWPPEEPEGSESREPEFYERLIGGGNQYEYYQPVYAEKSCVGCHNAISGGYLAGSGAAIGGGSVLPAPLTEGDLMAIVQVTIPNEPTLAALNWNRAILMATAIITAFLAVLASYLIIRYVIVKPLRHLRDVSDAVSHGNISLRADIHTGDEFESLAIAFNRMLRHLVAIQEELRDVNADLDAKVDELAQMNMRLYELNTIKSDFLATMSHELRTPLNSILGFSDVLGSINSLDEKQKKYVTNIRQSGKMLLEMINDILDLAKIEAGRMNFRLSDFRIEHVAGAQCDMARPLAERKNIDLLTEFDPDLPAMHQDQARVQQILGNLLSNAIKFTPEGGRIDVRVRSDRRYALLEVADTGVGIAPEDQHAIFEKFRQGRTAMPGGDAMTREYSGTGLGLSIVKELCKLLGGEVYVESQLGRGSTFSVRIPWRLEEPPRPDSSVGTELEGIGKPRLDFVRSRVENAQAQAVE